MGYTSGSTILDDEYNLFATGGANGTPNHFVANVNSVFGSGTGNIGYGQVLPLSAVSAGQVISAAQWATMLNSINTAAAHQGTSITAITNPTTGDEIAILAALNSNISTIYANRLNGATSSAPITAGGTVNRTTSWKNAIVATMTYSFGNTSQLRYFFNAGGRLTFRATRSGGSVSNKNTSWTSLLNAVGTINVASPSGAVIATLAGVGYRGTTKIGGSGSPTTLLSGTGFYNLTSSNIEIFKQFYTGTYAANYLSISVKVVGSVVTLSVRYQDDANANVDEIVDGTLSTIITAVPPGTTSISNSWGTPTLGGSQSGS